MAALEFALIAPILAITLMGTFDIVELVRVNDKLAHSAAMYAKIVAQSTNAVTSDSIADICQGVSKTMQPFEAGRFSANVQVLVHFSKGIQQVGANPPTFVMNPAYQPSFSQPCLDAASFDGTDYTDAYSMVPISGESVVMVKASYRYTPVLNLFVRPLTVFQTAYAIPRDNVPILYCTTNCGTQ